PGPPASRSLPRPARESFPPSPAPSRFPGAALVVYSASASPRAVNGGSPGSELFVPGLIARCGADGSLTRRRRSADTWCDVDNRTGLRDGRRPVADLGSPWARVAALAAGLVVAGALFGVVGLGPVPAVGIPAAAVM